MIEFIALAAAVVTALYAIGALFDVALTPAPKPPAPDRGQPRDIPQPPTVFGKKAWRL